MVWLSLINTIYHFSLCIFSFIPVSSIREANREQYKYIDGLPNSHKLTITGLRMNTLYLFSVMAYNDLGESKYLPDLQKAHTKGKFIHSHLFYDKMQKKTPDTKSKLN